MSVAARFASLNEQSASLEKLRVIHERSIQEALDDIDAEHIALVLPHRLTTLLPHIFRQGLTVLTKVAECVELADDLNNIHCDHVVYITLPQDEDVRSISTHAAALISLTTNERRFTLLAAGSWTPICADILKQQIKENTLFKVREIPLRFVPLDNDVLTLARERCVYDCYMKGNSSVLVDVALGLHQLQTLYGRFKHIKYIGAMSAYVSQRMMELDDFTETKVHKRKRRLKTLVLLDRRVDYSSALSLPLTYEALLDELFESKDGFVSVSPSHKNDEKPLTMALNSSDTVFQSIRSLNIHAVSAALNTHAIELKESFDHFRMTSAFATTAEVHEFVKGVPQMKETQETIERHVVTLETIDRTTKSKAFRTRWNLERAIMDMADNIIADIEEHIFRHVPLLTVLRLVCLHSIVNDGIPVVDLLRLKTQIIRTYGHEVIFSFDNLRRLGLLKEKAVSSSSWRDVFTKSSTSASTPFTRVTNALNVMDLEVNIHNPQNAAFVTGGYAPISCRLVEEILKVGNWNALSQTLDQLDGPRAEIRRLHSKRKKSPVADQTVKPKKKKVVVVCFIGGVTHIELAALRWVASFYPVELLVATTSMINGHTFLQDVMERMPATT